ncbi:hypothetical protein ACFE04_013622 [Oxalis oulophora]
MEEFSVVIIGAGPAGLAVSACLNRVSISNIVLERDDCCASLWRKRSYDRLNLHIANKFCELPYMKFSLDTPTFAPKSCFINYLDKYVSKFNIQPLYNRFVEAAYYEESEGKWHVETKNLASDSMETYVGSFLIIATGINSEGVIPNVSGLESFNGEIMHSNKYENGEKYAGKDVLVVGSGNSGMEIAFDLYNSGARASIVVRSPTHVVSKYLVYLGMTLMKYLPFKLVDTIILLLNKLKYGDTSKFGIPRPSLGPFTFKNVTGKTPTIDVGAMYHIKTGEIKVFPAMKKIVGNNIIFQNNKIKSFESIIFATGYRSTVEKWLKGASYLFDGDGTRKTYYPNHWKLEKKGLYCVGFSDMGLIAIANDARKIANDIALVLNKT